MIDPISDVKHFWRDIELIPVGTVVKLNGFLWTIEKYLARHYKLVLRGVDCTGVSKVPFSRTEELKQWAQSTAFLRREGEAKA